MAMVARLRFPLPQPVWLPQPPRAMHVGRGQLSTDTSCHAVPHLVTTSGQFLLLRHLSLCQTAVGLHGKVLVAGGIGVASVRSCEKLPPCLIEPVPAGSKTVLPLAKAKPVSEGMVVAPLE